MSVPSIYRIAEQALNLIKGSGGGAATNPTLNELKIAAGQVISKMLKIDYLTTNAKTGEMIPNGAVLAQYDGIAVTSYSTGKSRATLPVKPMKLPRNMGVFTLWIDGLEDTELIPLQLGQTALLKSQPLINELFGQIGYETSGLTLTMSKDIKQLYPNKTLSARLVIMDISKYDDYEPLPILPEQEWDVITEVYKMYSTTPISDRIVDATNKPNTGVPANQQKQTN